MSRLNFLVVCAAMFGAACGVGGVAAPNLPATVAPGWTRGAVDTMDASAFPALVSGAGVKRGWRTEYRGADGAHARVEAYALPSPALGLDLVQRWRPERDAAQFYTEHFLLNVSWEGGRREEVAMLVRNLPKVVESH